MAPPPGSLILFHKRHVINPTEGAHWPRVGLVIMIDGAPGILWENGERAGGPGWTMAWNHFEVL